MVKKNMLNFVYKVVRSFVFAFQGILSAAAERNMKVHLIASVFVLLLGILLNIESQEWFVILLLIAVVISAEMFNTAVEELSNVVRDELKLSYHATKRARDVSAGAVLILAIFSAIVGTAIFLPRIFLII